MRMIRRAIALAVLTAGLLGAIGSEAGAGEVCARSRTPKIAVCSPTNL